MAMTTDNQLELPRTYHHRRHRKTNRYDPLPVCLLLLLHLARVMHAAPAISEIRIGAMLSTEEDIETLQAAVREVNDNSLILPGNYQLNVTSIVMTNNPIESAIRVCVKIIPNQVYAVISGHSPELYMSSVSVSYTCGFYGIPVIGISARECIFSDKHIHKSYLRTVPPYSQQANVWADLVDHFEWNSVVTITSSDQDGRAILSTLRKRLEGSARFKIEQSIAYKPRASNLTDTLLEVRKCRSRVLLLYASEKDATTIFQDAQRLNMTGAGYAWVVTEQGITGEALAEAPEGTLGMYLEQGTDTKSHIQDAVRVIAKGIHSFVQNEGIMPPPAGCRLSSGESLWASGRLFYGNLVDARVLQGATGAIDFDKHGDRKSAKYKLINIQSGEPVTIGAWSSETRLTTTHVPIIWPGGTRDKPEGYELQTHLRVVIMKDSPFVYVDEQDPETKKCMNDTLPCLAAKGDRMQCCYGFCIDLLVVLAKELNFTFDLHQVHDGNYGNFEHVNGTERKRWTGMIGELVDDKADMIMAPLTINNERARYIDFSKPYKYQGLTILVKKADASTNLLSFMRPFQISLWLLIGVCIHVIAVVIYLLDRFSPFSHPRNGSETDALNLSQALWFSWSVLLNSGVGERTPRSFGARVLGVVWAGFAMIMVASYTANLAAYLVLDKPHARISGINDAKVCYTLDVDKWAQLPSTGMKMRNPSPAFTYATVSKSSVEMYFRRQVELSSMYRFMQTYNYKEADNAIEDLKSGKLDAFIYDSAMLDFEVSRDCGLITVGELFGRSGFGIGLQKGSLWTQKISLRILELHEKGKIGELDIKWITSKQCGVKSVQPTTLGLSSMGGVFILVAGGFLVGCIINRLEIHYKRHQQTKERQIELARVAVSHWRSTVRRRRKRVSSKYMVPAPSPEPMEKRNGVQGSSSIEKEMDGAIPLAVINRRSRTTPILQIPSNTWGSSADSHCSSPKSVSPN